MSLAWMVIYPRGDKNFLDLAQVVDYEEKDWSLASKKRFDEENEAANYAWELSKKSGIPINPNSNEKALWILDREE